LLLYKHFLSAGTYVQDHWTWCVSLSISVSPASPNCWWFWSYATYVIFCTCYLLLFFLYIYDIHILHICLVSGLLFLYSLFRLGICQCIGRSLCKMSCVTCQLCCFALQNITSNLWHKLINTKRVYRGRRRRDVELGYTSPSTDNYENSSLCDYRSRHFGRKRKSLRETSRRNGHSVHLSRMKRKSWRVESSRKIQLSKVKNQRGKTTTIKRRRHKRWNDSYD
jgi:hypothetical protein